MSSQPLLSENNYLFRQHLRPKLTRKQKLFLNIYEKENPSWWESRIRAE
jgi:hypothetical protein